MSASGGLVAKLGALVLVTALTAAALLAVRQQRIMAAHDLIETHRRIVEHERSLRQIRSDIGSMIAPAHVEKLASALGPMHPIPPELHDAQQRSAAERALAKSEQRRGERLISPKPKGAGPRLPGDPRLTLTNEQGRGEPENR